MLLISDTADGLSVHPANLFNTMLTRFLLAPPFGGVARKAGLNENNTVQLSKFVGSFAILIGISLKAIAHCTRVALGILFKVVFHLGWSRRDGGVFMFGSGFVCQVFRHHCGCS